MNTFPMNTKPDISLIFVNYRSVRYLAKALESLFSFEKETGLFEVIVVNNDVSEGSSLEALGLRFPFLLIENGTNIGFGRGNNVGAKRAQGKLLGFINPDILWAGPHLRGIGGVFAEKKQIGILGMGMVDAKRREEAWSAGTEPSLANLFRNNLLAPQQSYWKAPGLSFPDWVSGGALFVQKDLFSLIGGFDERFFLYFEDVDLCKEARRRGFSVARSADHALIHLGGQSSHSPQLQKKHFYASQRKYFEKHRPAWEKHAVKWLQFFFCKTSV
ncbi:MAG: glycosyltransferase family 2 protein [Candidatus Moraniibacteriota bacterium]